MMWLSQLLKLCQAVEVNGKTVNGYSQANVINVQSSQNALNARPRYSVEGSGVLATETNRRILSERCIISFVPLAVLTRTHQEMS